MSPRAPAYEAASLDNAGATLTRRVHQGDARETIPNSKWAFADCKAMPFPGKPDAGKVCLDGGFDTDHIYELVYTAKNRRCRHGFAATRDFAAFLRGDVADVGAEAVNPVAGAIDNTLIFGSSQSGRWIRTFIHLGFNESDPTRASSTERSRTRLPTAAPSTSAGRSRTACRARSTPRRSIPARNCRRPGTSAPIRSPA